MFSKLIELLKQGGFMPKVKVGAAISVFGLFASITICSQGCPKSFEDIKNCGCDYDYGKAEELPKLIEVAPSDAGE